MALADYFDRTATSASQILQRFDLSGFIAVLEQSPVALVLDGECARSSEGRATADLAVRLLARFYPSLALVACDEDASAAISNLRQLAKKINPAISLRKSLKQVKACLVIGQTEIRLPSEGPVIYLGSDGWVARLQVDGPVGSGHSSNPFGAGVAACLGAANLFRAIFGERLSAGDIDRSAELSLLNFKTGSTSENPSLGPVDLGESILVGLGAVGNGVLWALARCPIRGTLRLVDHDTLDLGNIQRYSMTVRKDENTPKTELAMGWLSDSGVDVVPYPMRWDDFAKGGDWRFDRVLTALDSAEDRVGVQASLPRWIANAWTQGGEAGLSRHPDFLDERACLACLYMPNREAPHEDELIASALGFMTEPFNHPERVEVRRRLHLGLATDLPFLQQISERKNIDLGKLRPFEGKPLRELYTKGVCSGMVLALAMDAGTTHAEVPMPFQSALAGLMLAAELVADCANLPRPREVVSRIDLTTVIPPIISSPLQADATKRCLCADDDFRNVYAEKYAP